MKWRDFFYFSKGERRALMLLLSLITIAWIVMILSNKGLRLQDKETQASGGIMYPVCIYPPQTNIQTSEPANIQPSPVATQSIQSAAPSSTKHSFLQKATQYKRIEKYPKGTIVELNTADTLILKKIPGIGSAFSNRIVKYRNLLGGFYSVTQLSEVYGIDEDRYNQLKEWFCVNPQLIQKKSVNDLPLDSLSRHPYINYSQAKVIKQLCRQKGKLTGWENLSLLEEFTEFDKIRVEPYLSFE